NPSWTAMRPHLANLGWRGSTPETFDDVFLCAVAERLPEIRRANSTLDTVVDLYFKKLSEGQQEEALKLFRQRLDREQGAQVERVQTMLTETTDSIRDAESTITHGESVLERVRRAVVTKEAIAVVAAEKAGRLDDLLAAWGQLLWTECHEEEDYDGALRE